MQDSNRPKRWTWEEWRGQHYREYPLGTGADKSFHVNEPLLNWQEKEIERLRSSRLEISNATTKEVNDLRSRIAKLQKALEFYSNKKNYEYSLTLSETFVEDDYGEIARTALKECFGEEK